MGVNPGIVLISEMTAPADVTRKSTRAKPSQPMAAYAAAASSRRRTASVALTLAMVSVRDRPGVYFAS